MTVAVVGAGQIADQHFGALAALEGIDVVACDRSPVTAAFAADRFGLEAWYDDFDVMMERAQPRVVHITTPAPSHAGLARRALEAGAHVLVEKPVALDYSEWLGLRDLAQSRDRWLVEDHTYRFSPPVARVLRLIEAGELGDVVHVSIEIALDIHADGSAFADRNTPHPSLALTGGAISDFLTHFAYLACLFVGDHEEVRSIWSRRNSASLSPWDEMRALVRAGRGTAALAFSGNAQPDTFTVEVHGTRMRAHMNLFENTLRLQRPWPAPRPVSMLLDGLHAGWCEGAGALRSLAAKLADRPGASEGIWELVRRLHESLRNDGPPPVTLDEIDSTNRLVHQLLAECPDS